MKLTRGTTQQGSTLVLTVITCTLIGSVLCSYLVLVSARNHSTMRGLAWNTAIPVLEAGIEEALTHLHDDKKAPGANEWTETVVEGQTAYWKRRDLPDGSYFYVTNVNSLSKAPLIFSAGYVKAPLTKDQYISRLVKVTTTNPPSVFTHAIAANGPVKLSGNAIVDGYNPSLGSYSSSNRNAGGSIATASQQAKAIDIGSGHIFGIAVTGPGGTVAAAGGSVGDLDWPLHAGIKEGWTNNNMNAEFQDVELPEANYQPIVYTSGGGSNVVYLGTGNYATDSSGFNSSSSRRPMIITGQATLHVKGDFTVGGIGNSSGYVRIEPGASLKLYVAGRASISGSGIVNVGQQPKDFSYNGLPTSTVLNYSGSEAFYGTINAPEANVTISGNASVYGAIICNTFTSSGNAGVHYDQSIESEAIFLVTSWRELP